MAGPFSRSLQFLEADRFGPGFLFLACLMLLLLLWGLWFFLVDVSVYIVSDRARLEVARDTYPLQASIAGRVVAVHGTLGEQVVPGDLILELDAREPRLALDEEQASRAGLATQIQSLRGEVAAQQRALEQFRRASGSALAQQQQLVEEAAAAARLAREEAERLARLRKEGVTPEVEAVRAESLARQSQATLRSLQHALERLRLEQQGQESEATRADQERHTAREGGGASECCRAGLRNSRRATRPG